MAKKASASRLTPGTRVRAREGVTVPEFPEMTYAGWTGTVRELMGKKSAPKYLIEWDDETIEQMPQEYRDQCEEQQVFYAMACLAYEDLQVLDA